MYVRLGMFGSTITIAITLGADKPDSGLISGSSGNFERYVEPDDEYQYEDRFGFTP